MNDITVYFGKINLVSEHIYKVYSNELQMRDIMLDILGYFQHGMYYDEENPYIGEDGNVHSNAVHYSVYIREKTDTYIRGRLDKESRLNYKVKNPMTHELENKSIKNTDAIEFYFDVFNEMVGYNTSQRFGYKKFLEIFAQMLNNAARLAEKDYVFDVDIYTKGININDLRNELKKINGIERLNIILKPINPDTEILNSIQQNGSDKLDEFEEANVSQKSIIFTSSSRLGLNLDSKLVSNAINEIDTLQKDVPADKATRNGYAKVEATGRDGVTRSTEDHKPVKRYISKIEEFVDACRDVIIGHDFGD